jgi:hypothetical protein
MTSAVKRNLKQGAGQEFAFDATIDLLTPTALTVIANRRRWKLKITDIRATLHRVPVEVPLLKEKIVTMVVFVTVETDKGVAGNGLTRGSARFGMKEFINREVAPFLRGKNPLETERIWQMLFKQFNPRAQTGMWSSAVSAVDIALWDIKGKHYRNRYGGSSAARRIPCRPTSLSVSNSTPRNN